ncbi:hypothetical protein [Herbiconiux sp. YIM B11900]|uniref:hypothetical protein n=1 Tax=Herbiconiux sp. YIM B11900 TaxID=3404131 RepID=UPI003F873546
MGSYPNGRAPSPPLVEIFGCIAMPDMAQRVYATKRDFELETPAKLIVNEIYRTYERQIEEKQRWTDLGQPGNAATPGGSKHGDDEVGAVDWACPDAWIPARRNIALRYGLHHDIANESWHATNWGDETHPLPSLEEALNNGAPTPITLAMLEEREFMTIAEDLKKFIAREVGRGAGVLYWDKEQSKVYLVSPRFAKHIVDEARINVALRDTGTIDEMAISSTTEEMVITFSNNGIGVTAADLRAAKPGAEWRS